MVFPSCQRASLAVAIAAALSASACSSTDVSVSAPSAAKCQVTVANSVATLPAAGGAGVLSVTTNRDCTWDVINSSSWVALTGDRTGQGSGQVGYRVNANVDPTARRANLTVNDAVVVIAQEAATCRFTVTPSTTSMTADGGTLSVRVETASAACSWTVASQASWLHVSSGSQSGTGSTTVSVEPNPGEARTGTVTVAGQTIRIEQARGATPTQPPSPSPSPVPAPTPPAPGCAFSLTPTQASVTAAGGGGTANVATTSGCAWSATSSASWLTVVGASSGTGPGAVVWLAAPSTVTVSRSATLTIGGRTLTVTQAAAAPLTPCTYSISPTSANISAADQSLTVNVITQAGCSWTVKQNDPWLEIGSASSGTGSGTVTIDVQRYKGNGQRTGTMTIAGQTFTVTQTRGNDLEAP